jgi:hypothetical protein
MKKTIESKKAEKVSVVDAKIEQKNAEKIKALELKKVLREKKSHVYASENSNFSHNESILKTLKTGECVSCWSAKNAYKFMLMFLNTTKVNNITYYNLISNKGLYHRFSIDDLANPFKLAEKSTKSFEFKMKNCKSNKHHFNDLYPYSKIVFPDYAKYLK